MSVMNPETHIMVFRPTMEEFRHFSRYIQYIESQGAHKAGIAKIIPPKEWLEDMNKQNYDAIDQMIIGTPIEQKITTLGTKSGGRYETRNTAKLSMKVSDFRTMTQSDKYNAPKYKSWDDLERKYWKQISYVSPIYGADVNGTLFGEEIDTWNVAKLNTILDYINENEGIRIAGVTNPYLYFGMWRATFPWHVEDMDLYSINYIHYGEPKTWYSISPEDGKRFETFAGSLFAEQSSRCPAWLRHKTTLIHPNLIRQNGIRVRTLVHKAGEFIVTFPYGYHAGFNHGFNVAESTNFANTRWIKFGEQAVRCRCTDDMVQIDMEVFQLFKNEPKRDKLDFNEIVKPPCFNSTPIHWREYYGVEKPDHDPQNIKSDMNRFCNQPHPPEMPPTVIKKEADEVMDHESMIGEYVYFQDKDERCHYGEIIAFKPIILYLIRNEMNNVEKIEPEDVMSKDCCNRGPPAIDEEVYFYNCQVSKKCQGRMIGVKQKTLFCILNENEKQYQIDEPHIYRTKEDIPGHVVHSYFKNEQNLKRKYSVLDEITDTTGQEYNNVVDVVPHHCEREDSTGLHITTDSDSASETDSI